MSEETPLTVEQKIERKKEINKQIKLRLKQIKSLIFDFELVFDTSVEDTSNITRIIAVEKDIENQLPAKRTQILDTLMGMYKLLKDTIHPKNIMTVDDISNLELRYIQSVSAFSDVFNINLSTSNYFKRIGNINAIRGELSTLYIQLGEIKTDMIDEVKFLELLKFINDRVNAKYLSTIVNSGAAASGTGISAVSSYNPPSNPPSNPSRYVSDDEKTYEQYKKDLKAEKLLFFFFFLISS
jgi:hypothetical protein